MDGGEREDAGHGNEQLALAQLGPESTPEEINEFGARTLPGLIGVRIVRVEAGRVFSTLDVRTELLAPNGYLHAASVVALADTTCGYGTMLNRPPDAVSFTTIDLACNLIGTARAGTVSCEATLVHAGRTTQVWDAHVANEAGKKIALFRCTQILIYEKTPR